MDILFDNQLGFRFWVSPHEVQAVTLIILNKKYSCGLFWHGKSWYADKKLEYYGIRGIVHVNNS